MHYVKKLLHNKENDKIRKFIGQKKAFVNHISDIRLISKIYVNLIQIEGNNNNDNNNNPIEKQRKD